MIDREKLNADRKKSTPVLAGVQAIYEGQFEKISMVHRAAGPSTFVALRQSHAMLPTISTVTLDNYEVVGVAGTLLGALVDWQIDLSSKPQFGAHLVWRDLPECDWSFDFATDKPIWKVYARFAILPAGVLR